MAALTDTAAAATPGATADPATGWGLACRFDCKATTLHGVVAIEFEGERPAVRQMQVIVSPIARQLNEINISRAWPDIIFQIVKNNLEPRNLTTDMMESLTGALRAAAAASWCEALRAMGEAGQSEALHTVLSKIIGSVIDVEFDLKVRYFATLAGTAAPAAAGEQTLTISPASDPARGVMLSTLKAGEDIFIKVLDDSPLGVMMRQQLGAVDDAGNLRAVARPFRELRALGERGNSMLYVDLAPGVVGMAEVYNAVKVKTANSVLQAAATAGRATAARTVAPAANTNAGGQYRAGFSWTPVMQLLIVVLVIAAGVMLFRMVTGQ